MQVTVSDAKARLTDLVRRAEAGEKVVLTRHGQAAVQLVAIGRVLTSDERMAVMERVRASGRAKAQPGLDAARSQDFLYDEDGMPA